MFDSHESRITKFEQLMELLVYCVVAVIPFYGLWSLTSASGVFSTFTAI